MKKESFPSPYKYKIQGKNKHFGNQMKTVYKAFSERPKTMLAVSVETGIMRANICRYVAHWRKYDRLVCVGFGTCPISKHRAGFYRTVKDLFTPETGEK